MTDAAPAVAETPAPPMPAAGVPAAGPPVPAMPAAGMAEPGQEMVEPGQETVHQSLSPSRAADFMTCPLLYRFRVIDRLPEPPSAAAARGTLVHAVLERLFDEPAAGRTPETARGLLLPQWDRLVAEEPELTTLFTDEDQRAVWLDEASAMLDRYFTLEDPTRLEPAHREMSVRTVLESGLTLRGYIDRLDVARTGEVRVVDYKTGTAPREEYEARALFQMKFYALVVWRTSGTIPRQLQLIYLGNGEIMRCTPDEADLLATERKINALWRAIERAQVTGDWRPRQSHLCSWCAHQALCPVFGGTPPPLPELPVTGLSVTTPLPAQAVPGPARPAPPLPADAVPADAVPADAVSALAAPVPPLPAQAASESLAQGSQDTT